MKLRQRILRAVRNAKGPIYADALVTAVRPANPVSVEQVASELVKDGALTVETGSWSGERVYSLGPGA